MTAQDTPPRRPLIKELMRMQRERAQGRAVAADGAASGKMADDAPAAGTSPQRPTIQALMRARRARGPS